MSRKQSSAAPESSFKRLLGWTLLLALVFSAGLITGERLVRKQSLEPLVVVNDQVRAGDASPDADAPAEQPTTFTFFDQLARKADVALMAPTRVEPAKPADKPADKPAPTVVAAPAEPAPAKPVAPVEPPAVAAPSEPAPAKPTAPPEKPAAPADTSAPDAARYTLQVAAHPDLDGARAHMERLRKIGLEPYMISAEIPGKGVFYRVQVGKFGSMDEARAFQASLKAKNSLNTFVSPL